MRYTIFAAFLCLLAACGGGGSSTDTSGSGGGQGPTAQPPTAQEAARLLTQGTFGVTEAGIGEVQSQGINGWITAQIALPRPGLSHEAFIDSALAANSAAVRNYSAHKVCTYADGPNTQVLVKVPGGQRMVKLALVNGSVESSVMGMQASCPASTTTVPSVVWANSVTVTSKDCVALRLGVPLSLTMTVKRFVVPASSRAGVQPMTAFVPRTGRSRARGGDSSRVN